MRQETGSSNIESVSKDIISVRVTMNGDSFVLPEVHISADSSDRASRPLCVDVLSKRTMLMPADLLSGASLESEQMEICQSEYSAGGMTLLSGEELLILDSLEDGDRVVALVSLSTVLMEELRSRGNSEVVYSVPMLRGRMSNSPHVIIDTIDGLSTIKVYSASDLQFADVFESANVDQVAYWAKALSDSISLNGYDLYIVRGDSSVVSLLRSSFNNMNLCE